MFIIIWNPCDLLERKINKGIFNHLNSILFVVYSIFKNKY